MYEGCATAACFRLQLQSLSLGGLFIPGTHNSACYKGSLSRHDTTFSHYLLTQDTSVWEQLVHGIRYLDLRVGYYPPGKKTQTKDHRTRYVLLNWCYCETSMSVVLDRKPMSQSQSIMVQKVLRLFDIQNTINNW
jgi:hypothetical protein